jgi:NADH-quinone oxidoreductase subunit L
MWFFTHVWIIPALMALSFLLILLFGKKMPKKGAEIGIVFVGAAFVLALITAGNWVTWRDDAPEGETEYSALSEVDPSCSAVAADEVEKCEAEGAHSEEADGHSSEEEGSHSEEGAQPAAPAEGESAAPAPAASAASAASPAAGAEEEEHEYTRPVARCATWFDTGDQSISIGTLVDGQSVLMLVVVTLISLLVHVFSTDYVGGDRRYTHYFAFLSLFTASMLFFVLSENTLQMIVGWELVGVCSFALIGHWWEEKPNSDAALKAFLTNRVGDVGLLVGVIILYFAAGKSFSILDINILSNEGGISHTLLMVASLCLITAVMSKSGQFILHTWLPDAMAGPTPVSALIHAATMVVAGIYMVARLYPVFFEGLSIAGSSVNALSVVGAVTALFGDARLRPEGHQKVLAYSTVSQLGFMVTALGVGAWTAALFHLFTARSSRPACSSAPARSATPATTASTWSTTWVACGRSCPGRSGPI